MSEPTIKLPDAENLPNAESDRPAEATKAPERTVDAVENLVTRGGYEGDPREIIENPAVTPEMPNEPGDLQADPEE